MLDEAVQNLLTDPSAVALIDSQRQRYSASVASASHGKGPTYSPIHGNRGTKKPSPNTKPIQAPVRTRGRSTTSSA